MPSPYPSLVTVGHDLDGAHVLVDLEHVGELAVDGDHDGSVAVLAAIAAELATSAWAEDLQVTLVGCLPDLPSTLGTGRVRHVATLAELPWRTRAPRRRCPRGTGRRWPGGPGASTHRRRAAPRRRLDPGDRPARRPGAAGRPGPARGAPAGPAAGRRGRRHRRHCVGASAGWTLTLDRIGTGLDATAVLNPLHLALRPQRLTAADLDQLLGLLAVADLPAGQDGGFQSTDPVSSTSRSRPSLTSAGTSPGPTPRRTTTPPSGSRSPRRTPLHRRSPSRPSTATAS